MTTNGLLDPYMSALTYYVLSKVGEPAHFLAVVCKQTKSIFCCSCHSWSCNREALRQHKRYCNGFKAWDEDDLKSFTLMYSEFAGKSEADRFSRLETSGLPIPGFVVSPQVKTNRAAPGPNGEKAEYPHVHVDAAVCLLCAACRVRHGRLDLVKACCNSFFIGGGLKAVVHANSRNMTLLVLDVSLDSMVPVDDPNHPNVRWSMPRRLGMSSLHRPCPVRCIQVITSLLLTIGFVRFSS